MASRPKKAAPRPQLAAPQPKVNGHPAEPVRVPVFAPSAPSDEEVRVAAYHKWLSAGCPPGDDMRFWFEAERELRANGN